MSDQTALPTATMSLDEVIADLCDAFDATVISLEQKALEDADREAEGAGEFGPIYFPRETGEPAEL